jgi:hypothetical protein
MYDLFYDTTLSWILIVTTEWKNNQYISMSRIGGVMVSVLSPSAVDRGFQPLWSQTNDYEIDICCLSAKHTTLRRQNKDWLAQNQNNVSEGSDMFARGLLFQWARTITIQLSFLV